MAVSLASAMGLFEKSRFDAAADAFAPLSGSSRAGVIARFRRAECLSRLGRHDEAVDEAQQAFADDSASSAPALWLAQTLAEAGRLDEAAEVALPATSAESLDGLRAGYRALARISRGRRKDGEDTVRAVLDTRHSPIYSLALRLTEADRLAREPRNPDLPSVWYAIECGMEMEHDKLTEHPVPPTVPESGFGRAEAARSASRWLRMHCSCADYSELVAAIRAAEPVPADLDEAELEMLLALGRIDAAEALAERLAQEAGKSAAGELAVDRARIAQLRGRPARPGDFDGGKDAGKRMGQMVAWLDMNAALLEGDALAARPLADHVADPSKREFVEAALKRWQNA